MTQQIALHAGDIITIGRSRKLHLVTSYKCHSDTDGWWVNELETVPLSDQQWNEATQPGVGPHYYPWISDKGMKLYYFAGGSMRGKGTEIKNSDVVVVGTSTLKKTVTVTFNISKIKAYGGR